MDFKNRFFLSSIFLLSSLLLFGQNKEIKKNHNGVAFSTELQKTKKASVVSPMELSDSHWDASLHFLGKNEFNKQSNRPLDILKKEQLAKKLNFIDQKHAKSIANQKSSGPEKPLLTNRFQSNSFDGGVPEDNSIAVSHDGYIVSLVNSNLFFWDEEGNKLFNQNFEVFAQSLNLPGYYYDPKIVFDPVEKRFIIVVLSGATPSTSNIVIMASSNSDPRENWNLFSLKGSPFDDELWFDFPSLAITKDDLFITGNLLVDEYTSFSDNILYQIDKESIYNGDSIVWVGHGNMRGPDGTLVRSIVPIGNGAGTEYGEEAYILGSDELGGDNLFVFKTSGATLQNPTLSNAQIKILPYEVPGNAVQPNTEDVLWTVDSRIWAGYKNQDKIFYTQHVSDENGFGQLRLNILDINTSEVTSSNYGIDTIDMAFPNIIWYQNTDGVDESIISYLSSGKNQFPDIRSIVVDENHNWSAPAIVKSGETSINALNGDRQRWGDYTGISNRFTDPPEVYIHGMIGQGFALQNWIGVMGSEGQAPIVDFEATRTEGNPLFFTTMRSSISGFTDSIRWDFPGGEPATSTKFNQTVRYREDGLYDVTLRAFNPFGTTELTKEGYLNVGNVLNVIDQENISDLNVYPNPLVNSDRFSIKIDLEKNQTLIFKLVDQTGRLIKLIKEDRVKVGTSRFEFNTSPLNKGLYYLLIIDKQHNIIANEKIVVSN